MCGHANPRPRRCPLFTPGLVHAIREAVRALDDSGPRGSPASSAWWTPTPGRTPRSSGARPSARWRWTNASSDEFRLTHALGIPRAGSGPASPARASLCCRATRSTTKAGASLPVPPAARVAHARARVGSAIKPEARLLRLLWQAGRIRPARAGPARPVRVRLRAGSAARGRDRDAPRTLRAADRRAGAPDERSFASAKPRTTKPISSPTTLATRSPPAKPGRANYAARHTAAPLSRLRFRRRPCAPWRARPRTASRCVRPCASDTSSFALNASSESIRNVARLAPGPIEQRRRQRAADGQRHSSTDVTAGAASVKLFPL